VSFRNSGNDRSYISEYTINTTNTWEYKTITVSASPSAGTWDYINGVGLTVRWVIASGSTFHTTAGAWQTGNFLSTVNQVNGVNTGATDFRITGVMLNEGVVATSFGLFGEDFAGEVVSCQRYYEKSNDLTEAPYVVSNGFIRGQNGPNSIWRWWAHFKVEKRTGSPTIIWWNPLTAVQGQATIAGVTFAVTTINTSTSVVGGQTTGGAANGDAAVCYTVDAEL
jgi:hypothetical protein